MPLTNLEGFGVAKRDVGNTPSKLLALLTTEFGLCNL